MENHTRPFHLQPKLKIRILAVAAAAVLALTGVACGSSDESGSDDGGGVIRQLDGVYIGSLLAIGDDTNSDLGQWRAIVESYGGGKIDLSSSMGLTVYQTTMALSQALDGIEADGLTSASIITKIKAMPELPLPAGASLTYRCNGAANPLTPASCTSGSLMTTLDEDGTPTLPYKPLGGSAAGG